MPEKKHQKLGFNKIKTWVKIWKIWNTLISLVNNLCNFKLSIYLVFTWNHHNFSVDFIPIFFPAAKHPINY